MLGISKNINMLLCFGKSLIKLEYDIMWDIMVYYFNLIIYCRIYDLCQHCNIAVTLFSAVKHSLFLLSLICLSLEDDIQVKLSKNNEFMDVTYVDMTSAVE